MFLFLAIFVYAVWSTAFPLAKLTLEHTPPLFLTGVKMCIAGILILGYLVIRDRAALKISWKQLGPLCLLAFCGVYFSNALECWGLQYLSAAKTCFIFSLGPFFSALFSYLHFGEKMTRRKWFGMLIGFLGILPVLYLQKGGKELLTSIPMVSWPELAAVGATISAVYGWVILRGVVKDTSPSMANGTSMLIGGSFALIHSFVVEGWHPLPVLPEHLWTFTQRLLLIIFISNLLCYNLYGMLLKRFTATLLSFLGLFSPIFACLSSWLILGEQPSLVILFSTGILLFGLWLVYSAELRQGYLLKDKEPVTT